MLKSLDKMKVKGIRKDWTFEVINETLVPKAYMSIDSKKINDAIDAGIREIDGIRIFQKESFRS